MTDKRKIAFQGVPGAYSHMACKTHAPKHIALPCESFSEMIAAVQNGDAELAMVPVENSTAGRVADIHICFLNQAFTLSVSITSQSTISYWVSKASDQSKSQKYTVMNRGWPNAVNPCRLME